MATFKNVLLLIADDWSPIAGCYGNPVIQTPAADGLAARGTRFTHAFCTSPSCAPSRATLLTGLHSHAHGQYGLTHARHHFSTLPAVRTLPQVLAGNGVFTGILGKLHCEPPDQYPFSYDMRGRAELRDPNRMREAARGFFSEADGKPFYLHVGVNAPHREGDDAYGNTASYDNYPNVVYSPDEVIVPDFLPDTPAVRRDLADYYTAVSRMDANYGVVLEELRRSGREEETLVVMTSDHGMPFPGAKAWSYDTGHHCPLIVRLPGQRKEGVVNDSILNWTDVMPTLLDWFGLEHDGPCHGRSFLGGIEEEHPPGWEETTFSHTFHGVAEYYPYRAFRGRRYKYLLNLAPELTHPIPSDLYEGKTWQAIEKGGLKRMGKRTTRDVFYQPRELLFDIEADPMETQNLTDDPGMKDRLDDFRARMRRFREETDDFWLTALDRAEAVDSLDLRIEEKVKK